MKTQSNARWFSLNTCIAVLAVGFAGGCNGGGASDNELNALGGQGGTNSNSTTVVSSGGNSAATSAPSTGGVTATSAATGGKSSTPANATGGLDPFWTQGYSPTQWPTPADGHHNAGLSCISAGCHDGSETTATAYLLAGTLFGADGFSPASNVEVGVSDGTHTYFTYSAGNGNFWIPASAGTLDFAKASLRTLSAKGQRIQLPTTARGPDCNACHKVPGVNGATVLMAL